MSDQSPIRTPLDGMGARDSHLVQLRPPIRKAEGVTPSERKLGRMAETSFLNLWSYPAPYRDQKQNGTGDGKELCDLLVVCSPYILIFSEKTVAWSCGSLQVAWSRWYNRTIRGAARQARGAERWIEQHPDRVFLDRHCKEPFPIPFPDAHIRQIHRIVVASGASQACSSHTHSASGSLLVTPPIQGGAHWSSTSEPVRPFHIGDVDPSGPFVHVFNDVALEMIMLELDTIRDFTDYLDKRAALVRSGRLDQPTCEEDLLAYYAIRINSSGEHDFVPDDETDGGVCRPIRVSRSAYTKYKNDPRYEARRSADEISYMWDRLVETFTKHMLNGTSITLPGHSFVLKNNELGVRHMALERRFHRRHLATAVAGALKKGAGEEIFFRMMMGKPGQPDSETAFFILTVKCPDPQCSDEDYQTYRQVRTGLSARYALGALEKHPHLERVVGISCEPMGAHGRFSEDMIYAEQSDWTEEERRQIRGDCEEVGVLRSDMRFRKRSVQEFPEVVLVAPEEAHASVTPSGMNRRQRRTQAARKRHLRRPHRSMGRDR